MWWKTQSHKELGLLPLFEAAVVRLLFLCIHTVVSFSVKIYQRSTPATAKVHFCTVSGIDVEVPKKTASLTTGFGLC